MRLSRIVALATMGILLGGCTSPQARQELSRLQSQVGILDERVTQLERSVMTGGAPGEYSSEPQTAPSTAVNVATQPVGEPATVHGSASTTAKPTTRQIQQALKNAGFYQGAIDGKLGPQTRSAIKEFQRLHGLVDDGVAGKKTWAKLQAYADLSEAGAAEVLK